MASLRTRMVAQDRYRLYGLTVESSIPLRGLAQAGPGRADVRIEITRARNRPQLDAHWTVVDPSGVWRAPAAVGHHLLLRFRGVPEDRWADLVIDSTGEVLRVTLSESSNLADAAELVLGNVFSCVLAQRGITCLHASVIAVGDSAVALIGPKGTGKSTLALALLRCGGRLLSDDVAPIVERDGCFGTAPGRTALRIRPDSASTLGVPFDELPALFATAQSPIAKRYHGVGPPSERAPSWLPLAAVFLLAPRSEAGSVSARAVSAAELLPALLANRHMARVHDHVGHRRDFALLAALVQAVPGRRLLRPDGLAAVGEAAQTVLREVQSLRAERTKALDS